MEYKIEYLEIDYIDFAQRSIIDQNEDFYPKVSHALGYSKRVDNETNLSIVGLVVNVLLNDCSLDMCVCAFFDLKNEPQSLKDDKDLCMFALNKLYPEVVDIVSNFNKMHLMSHIDLKQPNLDDLYNRLILLENDLN